MGLKIQRSRSLCNLVMSLASYEGARSVVELSESPVFHYQYSSIGKAIRALVRDEADRPRVEQAIRGHCAGEYVSGLVAPVLLSTDSTPVRKPHSHTLKDRGYVAVPNNVIRGNKAIDVGYDVSFVNLCDPASSWSLPLSVQRVGIDESTSERALSQLETLLSDPELGLSERLCINTLDSKYGNAAFLCDAFKHDDLVNITRMRAGSKVWKRDPKPDTGGAPRVYGEQFYLNHESREKHYKKHPQTGQAYSVFQRSIFENQADEQFEIEATMNNGRNVRVRLWRWNDMLIRTKKGKKMNDKPFDLLAIKVFDAQTDKLVFDRQMYVAINGKRKAEISTEQGYQGYRKRYDTEPYFRFAKQKLFLDTYQTPDVQHLDNWLLVLQMASWLLFRARDEVCFIPKKWRKYLPENNNISDKLSIAQTRHAAQALFLTFDPEPFKPRKSKKGRPRQQGETQPPRKRYKPRKKQR